MHGPDAHEAQDDRTLLGAIAAGDKAAFHAFYRRHAGRLMEYALRASHDRGAAEEVVQEAFAAVWMKAKSYQGLRGAPLAWLYVITRSKLVDRWRSTGARERLLGPSEVLAGEAGGDGAFAPDAELSLSLEKALSGLSPEQRRSIELAYFGGYTQEEAAEALHVPLGTFKSRIRAALGAMRGVLGGEP